MILTIIFKVVAVILTLFVALPIMLHCAEDLAIELVYSRRESNIGKNLIVVGLCLFAVALMMIVLFGEAVL